MLAAASFSFSTAPAGAVFALLITIASALLIKGSS